MVVLTEGVIAVCRVKVMVGERRAMTKRIDCLIYNVRRRGIQLKVGERFYFRLGGKTDGMTRTRASSFCNGLVRWDGKV